MQNCQLEGLLNMIKDVELKDVIKIPKSTIPIIEVPCSICGRMKYLSLNEINLKKREKKKYRCGSCRNYFPINDPKQWKIIDELLSSKQ